MVWKIKLQIDLFVYFTENRIAIAAATKGKNLC